MLRSSPLVRPGAAKPGSRRRLRSPRGLVLGLALLGGSCSADDEPPGPTVPPTTALGGSTVTSGGAAGAGVTGGGGAGGLAGTAGQGGVAGPCPPDMVLAGPVCIDRYEAPNEAGAWPLAMQTAPEGEAWCAARGKRLCSDVEWIRACEGVAGTLYPYGDQHVPHRCNDDQTWIAPDWSLLASWPSQAAQDEAERLYQADPSGFRADCVSADGAHDLTGNVAEWVVRTLPNGTDYDHVMKGCYWAGCYGGTWPNCTFVNPAHPGEFRTYEAGFRCCI